MMRLIIILLLVSGCDVYMERAKSLGRPPKFRELELPMQKPEYKPVAVDSSILPDVTPTKKNSNSLWSPGSRQFFKDQRARRVGDLLKIVINIKDNAVWQNKTEQIRAAKESSSVPNLYGLENRLAKLYKGKFNPATLLNIVDNDDLVGNGTINRQEAVTTNISAVVTQILPNGNLIIRGHQEIRVNYELREIIVEGIVRPEDISSNNSVTSDQIAEARISYGGRGKISDLQQPRMGNQILDLFAPF